MADEWIDVSSSQASSQPDEWQDVKSSPQMGFGDMAFDTLARAGMGAYDATKWLPGVSQLANIVPGKLNSGDASADAMSQNLKNNANFGQNIIQGTGQGFATLPQVLPFVKAASSIPMIGKALGGSLAPIAGMAGFGATTAGMQGQNSLVGAAQGAGQGLTYSTGNVLGSKLAQMAFNPIAKAIGGGIGQGIAKAVPAVGATVGSAGASALLSPDNKVTNAIVGGTLGGLSPMGDKSYQETLQDAADTHAKILGLGKGPIQKVEQKSGKELNDSYQLAAQHGLIYTRGQEGKLDTKQAQSQLQPFMDTLHSQADAIVSSDPNKMFDLQKIGDEAKQDLRNDPKFKNDLAYNQAKDQIDAHIDAAIGNRGQFVDAPTLNNIKQGMWNASFEPLQANNNAVARQLGNTAKTHLEYAFPGTNLGAVNAQLGKYLDLKAVLSNANGNTIDRGKLGKYVSEGIGGGIGAMAGSAITVPVLRETAMGAGAIAGTKVGELANQMATDPERITRNLANKVQLSQLKNGVNVSPKFAPVTQVPPVNTGIGQFSPNTTGNNPQGIILGQNGKPLNPMSNPVSPQFNPLSKIGNNKGIVSIGEDLNGKSKEELQQSLDFYKQLQSRASLSPDKSNMRDAETMVNKITNAINGVGKSTLGMGMAGGLLTASALSAGSMFNPLNAQAQQVKEPERLKLPADQYTKKEEVFQPNAYIDTKGNKTIGYGFNMSAVGKYLPDLVREGKIPLTKPVADKIFTKLYANARNSAESFVGDKWHNLNGQQQKALTDMSYNMGSKLGGFKNMRQAIEDGDFQTASQEIMNSNYAKDARNRAMRNSVLMKG